MSFNRTVKVESSTIAELGFDPDRHLMVVQFKVKTGEGAWYSYENIGSSLFTRLLNAESIGAFFDAEIKKKPKTYPYAKLLSGPTKKATS